MKELKKETLYNSFYKIVSETRFPNPSKIRKRVEHLPKVFLLLCGIILFHSHNYDSSFVNMVFT